MPNKNFDAYSGCCGKYIYQKDVFDDYFQCIMEEYKCDKCGYICRVIKDEQKE